MEFDHESNEPFVHNGSCSLTLTTRSHTSQLRGCINLPYSGDCSGSPNQSYGAPAYIEDDLDYEGVGDTPNNFTGIFSIFSLRGELHHYHLLFFRIVPPTYKPTCLFRSFRKHINKCRNYHFEGGNQAWTRVRTVQGASVFYSMVGA